jgi:outer membrane protein TolC
MLFCGAALGQTIAPGEVLTLSRAIDIALKTQPSVQAGMYAVRANVARVGQARSNYYPQFTASGSYSRVSPATSGGRFATVNTDASGTSTVSASGNTASGGVVIYDLYTAQAGVTQMVYDFGRTSGQVKINKLTADSSRQDLAGTENSVALNVKQAYHGALQAERNRDVARQTAGQLEEHLTQARGLLEAGTRTRFDVTQAEVNLSNARLALVQAENQVRLTRLNLNNAMGVAEAPDYRLEDVLTYTAFDLPQHEALATAYARRPDLRSLVARRQAAEQSVALARSGYLPQLSANASYYYTGTDFPREKGWTYGLSLSVPIFNGFVTRYQVQEAQANLDAAGANERSLRLTIYTQIHQGYLTLREAAERIATSRVAVRQAKENLDLATGRYQAGVGISLDVIDAIVTRGNTEVAYTQALADYRNAQAAIENAIGTR